MGSPGLESDCSENTAECHSADQRALRCTPRPVRGDHYGITVEQLFRSITQDGGRCFLCQCLCAAAACASRGIQVTYLLSQFVGRIKMFFVLSTFSINNYVHNFH